MNMDSNPTPAPQPTRVPDASRPPLQSPGPENVFATPGSGGLDTPAIDDSSFVFKAVRPLRDELTAAEPAMAVADQPNVGVEQLLRLLGKSTGVTEGTSASRNTASSRLLGRSSRQRYLRAIQTRDELLLHALSTAGQLPIVLNPVAPGEAADVVESPTHGFVAGPLGFTLTMFFDSAPRLFGALRGTTGATLTEPEEQQLAAGLELWQRRFELPELSRKAVAASVMSGLVDRLNRVLMRFPGDEREGRHLSRRAEQRLSELLDMADLLALECPEQTRHCALDYHENHRSWRARRLLRKSVEHEPDCAATQAMLARILDDSGGRDREALQAYQRAVELEPEAPGHHHAIGLAALRRLKFDRALASLARARALSSDPSQAHADLGRAQRVQGWLQTADTQDTMPGIELDDRERADGRFHPETLAVAAELYRRHGTLRIGGVFDTALIARCREQFLYEYRQYFTAEKKADALQIGNRRFQVSITLGGAFNDPGLYANPFILALLQHLLGKRMVIGSTVCATSLPGAKDQHWHKDHRALFTQHEDDTPPDIPPVAITTMIPLVDLDEQIGTTLVRKGSHRAGERASARLPEQVPIVPAGSCFLMDLSLSHKGQGNRTDRVRPIVNMVYHQSWFSDNKNFKLQRPLHVPAEEFQRMPEEHRKLVGWAIQPGPRVNL